MMDKKLTCAKHIDGNPCGCKTSHGYTGKRYEKPLLVVPPACPHPGCHQGLQGKENCRPEQPCQPRPSCFSTHSHPCSAPPLLRKIWFCPQKTFLNQQGCFNNQQQKHDDQLETATSVSRQAIAVCSSKEENPGKGDCQEERVGGRWRHRPQVTHQLPWLQAVWCHLQCKSYNMRKARMKRKREKEQLTAAKSVAVAARRARVVAWLPSSTCPHWANRKTRMATEARVPTPAAVAMAVTQASRLHAASPLHIPF